MTKQEPMPDRPNYIPPEGYARLHARYAELFGVERPKLVETISWAAGNGDRSENGDYIYGRKKLREIDRRIGWLSRRMKDAKVIDPAQQPDRSKVFFGATVTLVDEDETDPEAGRIAWSSPIGRAIRGAAVSDVRRVNLPAGERELEIVAISYPG